MNEWPWSIRGTKLTKENGSTPRKSVPSATLSATNPTSTVLGLNPGLRGEKPVTNRLSQVRLSFQYYATIYTSTPIFQLKFIAALCLVYDLLVSSEET